MITSEIKGCEAAEKQVAALLEEYAHTITTVRMQPDSELHVYHCCEGALERDFKCSDVDSQIFDELHLVVSPSELAWTELALRKKKNLKLR